METKAPTPLRELLINSEVDAGHYRQLRTELFGRANGIDELKELLDEAKGDLVREASALALTGSRDAALELLRTAPDNPWAVHLLGYLLLHEGRSAGAHEVLAAGWATHKGIREIGELLVEAFVLADENEKAAGLLTELNLDLDSALGHYLSGLVDERAGDYEAALQHYEQSVEADPSETRYCFRLGYLHSLHGDENRAREAYELCQRTTPVYTRAMINLGIIYEDAERYEDAHTCYKMVLSAYPEHERAKLYLADVEASLDMYYDREKEKEKNRRKQLLQIPVTDFELSVRSRNCLAKMSIHTLGDLIQKSEAELLSYKNFGETSLSEIKKILAQKGFRLGQGLDDKPRVGAVADPEKSSLLSEPVSVLELSSRAQRCMDRLGIESLADLCKRTELELISQRNFGVTSLHEVKRKLKERSLSLASG